MSSAKVRSTMTRSGYKKKPLSFVANEGGRGKMD